MAMLLDEFEVLYSYCEKYRKLKGKRDEKSVNQRIEILDTITSKAHCTESSARQYLSLYCSMAESKQFPKNAVEMIFCLCSFRNLSLILKSQL